jgi:hypothetical protein
MANTWQFPPSGAVKGGGRCDAFSVGSSPCLFSLECCSKASVAAVTRSML